MGANTFIYFGPNSGRTLCNLIAHASHQLRIADVIIRPRPAAVLKVRSQGLHTVNRLGKDRVVAFRCLKLFPECSQFRTLGLGQEAKEAIRRKSFDMFLFGRVKVAVDRRIARIDLDQIMDE